MRHGSQLDPPNRFERVHAEADHEQLEWDTEYLQQRADRKVQYLPDAAKTIVSENDSPDIPFRYSVNPYRGCTHGCSYCYARNTHEYLGLNAGLDFETRIFFKPAAAQLLRTFLARDKWKPQTIMFSGITDCYQPVERKLQLTRQCLEVALECRQPVGIITKNALIVRDLDLLAPLAASRLVQVNLSINSLNAELARELEPLASIPAARLRAVKTLAEAGVPVRVMVAPLIPGLNDHEVPAVIKAAFEAGARDVSYTLLRLPLTVEPVFREWLQRTQPLKAGKIESLICQTREGKLYDSTWGARMKGTGNLAEQIRQMFHIFQQRHPFPGMPKLDTTQFRPPCMPQGQLRFF